MTLLQRLSFKSRVCVNTRMLLGFGYWTNNMLLLDNACCRSSCLTSLWLGDFLYDWISDKKGVLFKWYVCHWHFLLLLTSIPSYRWNCSFYLLPHLFHSFRMGSLPVIRPKGSGLQSCFHLTNFTIKSVVKMWKFLWCVLPADF